MQGVSFAASKANERRFAYLISFVVTVCFWLLCRSVQQSFFSTVSQIAQSGKAPFFALPPRGGMPVFNEIFVFFSSTSLSNSVTCTICLLFEIANRTTRCSSASKRRHAILNGHGSEEYIITNHKIAYLHLMVASSLDVSRNLRREMINVY